MTNILLCNILSILKDDNNFKYTLILEKENNLEYKISVKGTEIDLLVSSGGNELFQKDLTMDYLYEIDLVDFRFVKFIEVQFIPNSKTVTKKLEIFNCHIEELFVILCKKLRERAHLLIQVGDEVLTANYVDGKIVFIQENNIHVKFVVTNFFKLNVVLGDFELISMSAGYDRKSFRELKQLYKHHAKQMNKTFIE